MREERKVEELRLGNDKLLADPEQRQKQLEGAKGRAKGLEKACRWVLGGWGYGVNWE